MFLLMCIVSFIFIRNDDIFFEKLIYVLYYVKFINFELWYILVVNFLFKLKRLIKFELFI